MKVNEICKVGFSRPVFNDDIIDGRGFVKTPPYINSVATKPLNNAKMSCSRLADRVCHKGLNVAQPLNPSIK